MKIIERTKVSKYLDMLLSDYSKISQFRDAVAVDKKKAAQAVRNINGLIHKYPNITREMVENSIAYSLGFVVVKG